MCDKKGQVDLAETDENENERGNENEKGNGRQDGYKCGIGRRPCKLMRDSVVHPETKYHRLKTGCSLELYNFLGQHTQKYLPVWSLAGPFWSLHLATGS